MPPMAMAIDMRGGSGRKGSVALGTQDLAERARAFSQARRHTAVVRALRVALPLGIVGVGVLYGVVLTMTLKIGSGRLNVGQVEITPDDLTMKNPSYFGVTKDGGRYEVRAKRAVVEFNQQAPIKLFDVDGDLVQINDVTTKLKANRGLLDNAKGELELFDGIEIDGSNGLSARLFRATVFSKEHRVVSKQPVDVLMPTGRVQGASMTLRTVTKEATFVGDVKVRLAPSAGQEAALGVGRDARQPVDVTSDQLYVNDASKVAMFAGKVVAVQGDSKLAAPELHATYEGKAAADLVTSSDPSQSSDGSRLTRLAAKGGSVVTVGTDRRIASDRVDFDAKADTALFSGGVLVNQQKNVLQGRRLFYDRKAGHTKLESPPENGQPAGRITATLYQGSPKPGAAPATPKTAQSGGLQALQDGVMGSFKTDPNAPLDVEADTLDVYDSSKEAVFVGNVRARQGDFVVRTVEMTAFYTGQAGFGLGGEAAADQGGKTPAQLTRVEARQKVLITSKDGQTATGDWAIFDVKANTVLLGDQVVVTRGKDVAEGPRLKIDLTTGMYRFETETVSAPAASESSLLTGPGAQEPQDPAKRACPPGKQCLLFYPKETKERAQGAVKKLAPAADGWQPSTSASPVLRGN